MTGKELLTKYEKMIENAMKSTDKNMLTMCGAISAITTGELYKEGATVYENAYEYAMDKFGISKSSVSEAVNLFKAFGNAETGVIAPAWKDYKYSQLRYMRKLPVNMLEKVKPQTSVREIQDMLKSVKELEKKEESEDAANVSVNEGCSHESPCADETEKVTEEMRSENGEALRASNEEREDNVETWVSENREDIESKMRDLLVDLDDDIIEKVQFIITYR